MIVSYLPISSTKTTTTVTTQGHILLLSRSCYTTFGPSFYSRKQLKLTSLVPFADTVLTNANPLFLSNIRRLSLTINEKSLWEQAGVAFASSKELVSREVSRLSTLLKWYPELADGLEYVKLTYEIARRDLYISSQINPDTAESAAIFGLVERDQNECFTKFGNFLWAKVMKYMAPEICFRGERNWRGGLRMRTMSVCWMRGGV